MKTLKPGDTFRTRDGVEHIVLSTFPSALVPGGIIITWRDDPGERAHCACPSMLILEDFMRIPRNQTEAIAQAHDRQFVQPDPPTVPTQSPVYVAPPRPSGRFIWIHDPVKQKLAEQHLHRIRGQRGAYRGTEMQIAAYRAAVVQYYRRTRAKLGANSGTTTLDKQQTARRFFCN